MGCTVGLRDTNCGEFQSEVLMSMAVNVGLLMALFAGLASGQGRPEPGDRPDTSSFLFFQAVNLSSDAAGMSRVDVHYRINNDFFIALKSDDPTFPAEFKRRGELLIELFDFLGISRAREIKRLEMGASTSEPLLESIGWHQGFASFDVHPGRYSIVIEADDLASERRYINRERSILARSFLADSLETSTAIVVGATSTGEIPYSLPVQNFGGNIRFGARGGIFLELAAPVIIESPVSATYRISTVVARFQEAELIAADTLNEIQVVHAPRPELSGDHDSLLYTIRSGGREKSVGIFLPLKLEQLPLRMLELHLTLNLGERKTELKERFQVIWPEMPLSLRDVDMALNTLKHITKPSQLDSLKRGSFERKRANLETFWKEKDPTPDAAINEMMAEYYRRVDYANRNFGTFKDREGWNTDRGRIYIIHGPPTKADRILSPDAGFREIWLYESLQKKFVFADKSRSGNYVLVSTQTL